MGGTAKRLSANAPTINGDVLEIKFYAGTLVPGVHWKLFLEIIASWVMTLVFAGLISAAVCSFAVGAKYPVVGPEAIVAQNGSVIEGGYVPVLDDDAS